MPQQPSRRDIAGVPPERSHDLSPAVRHHGSYLQGINPGYLGGRYSTPQLVPEGPSPIVGGNPGGDGGVDNNVLGEDGDRLTLVDLGDQTWTLSFIPIAETIHVHWHPDAGAGVEWKRDEHYFIDDDGQIITIYASALAEAKAEVGDVFSAQYLYLEGESDADSDSPLETLVPVGTTLMINGPDEIDLPAGTEVGDLIVALCATSKLLVSEPSDGTITDPRLTHVGYGMWLGIATHLGPVTYINPSGDRLTGTVATFRAPAYYKNIGLAGPGGGGTNTLAVPTVSATAAVMGFIEENRNGFGGSLDSWPTGYTKLTADSGSTICKAYILYWDPDGVGTSPSGSVGYNAHANGSTYVDVAGLQGEES